MPPYSLGKLIDWKLNSWESDIDSEVITLFSTPYSLGKLIDWKRVGRSKKDQPKNPTPYSLGKLIDWKLDKSDLRAEVTFSISLLAREIN